MRILIFVIFLLVIQTGRAMEMILDGNGLPHLTQFSEQGFVDCVFRITKWRQEEGSYWLHLEASLNDEVLGFDVVVQSNLRAGLDGNAKLVADHVYRQGVRFIRSGPESDFLISILAVLYGAEPALLRMVDEESFTGIVLAQGAIDIENQAIKIKLFGNDSENDGGDDYYESFFNLDLKNGFVYWNEKDPAYRGPLIRSLSERAE